ncbi:FHA domain-containing protein [Herpetosiphon gulosus]|uniref:FHA domain-containing protein n=1 Tax=Herpetosiphon gulosus TaxID=1973496 RepID=A0ABP9WW45_9CHLR
MKCPSCGHTNDGGNRFCEYCGARLDPSMNQEATQIGAVPNLHTDQSYDAPTMFVPADQAPPAPPAQAEPAVASVPAASSLNCAECGYINQPGDRYCDQCGASLDAAPAAVTPVATPAPVASEALTPPDGVPAVPVAEPHLAELTNVAPAEELPTVPIDDQQPVSTPVAEAEPVVPVVEEPVAMPVAEAEPVVPAVEEPVSTPVAEVAPVAEAAPVVDEEAVAAERTALSAAVIEQEDNLVMFEQMANRYAGRALPAHIAAGIEETKASLAEAQANLAAFDQAQAVAKAAAEAAAQAAADAAAAAAAQPDPEEVARLEAAITEHQDNLAMFEQMSARYAGRALPAHIAAGLEESKHALAEAEAELAALLGGAPVVPAAAPIPSAPVNTYDAPTVAAATPAEPAPTPVVPAEPVPAPEVEAAPAWAAPTSAEPVAAPVVEPVQVSPHLVVAGSQVVLNLPTDKQIYVIGREDPISGIYPEVDLTNHGGEGGGVSRQHARLHNTGGGWMLEDLNSTNYSKVNGQKLAPHAPAPVNHGDQLQFGKVVVTLHLH